MQGSSVPSAYAKHDSIKVRPKETHDHLISVSPGGSVGAIRAARGAMEAAPTRESAWGHIESGAGDWAFYPR